MVMTVLVRNVADHDVKEEFPFYGAIEIAKGETKRIPEDVAQAWETASRNGRVLIERVSDEAVVGPTKRKGRKPAADIGVVDSGDDAEDLGE